MQKPSVYKWEKLMKRQQHIKSKSHELQKQMARERALDELRKKRELHETPK